MRAIALHSSGGLDRLEMQDRPDPGEPGPGEIRVALHGNSLNFHDLGVATGRVPVAEGRMLGSDSLLVVLPYVAPITRASSRSSLPRPYIWRLTSLSLVICPSV